MASSTLPVISPKLTRDNYRFWKSQILFVAGSHDLGEHLTGLISCPTPFIKIQSESSYGVTEKKPNPAYVQWKKTDKSLVSWLLGSISESMFSVVSKGQFSTKMWIVLEKEFLTESRSKTLHIKNLLQSTRKDNLNIHDYFMRMKGFAKVLSSSGITVTDEELLNYILDGLTSEYDAAVVNITTRLESRLDPLSVQEAQKFYKSMS
ncbi:uncharacterized protein LOC116140601 [Pistacia vera]|uniref:uncharacterized protein LOC116140601 n=1 Tax=Pistacia vera TaxID=55513 RepID=UPI001263222B|nr:uncharacterized protein LOC116140601 [Pistacia vera]